MKKAKKRTTRRTTGVTPKRVARKNALQTFFIKRFTIVTTLGIAVVAMLFIGGNKGAISQSVAGASVFRPLYAQATVSWNPVAAAVRYNIYYKQQSEATFTNAVRNIPQNIHTYTISYLKKNTAYTYRISGVNAAGREFWWSSIQPLTNITGM